MQKAALGVCLVKEEITRKRVLLTALSHICVLFPRVAILSGKVGILGRMCGLDPGACREDGICWMIKFVFKDSAHVRVDSHKE